MLTIKNDLHHYQNSLWRSWLSHGAKASSSNTMQVRVPAESFDFFLNFPKLEGQITAFRELKGTKNLLSFNLLTIKKCFSQVPSLAELAIT